MGNEQIVVTGNTYSARDQLRAAGGQWDAVNKRWVLPASATELVQSIRVPVGGQEELWAECERCGSEPVDGSGLCASCRGTKSLTISPLQTPEEEAAEMLEDLDDLTMTLYASASRGDEVALPDAARQVAQGSPLGGGYHVNLLSDGESLYALYVHHHDGDHNRCYRVEPSGYKPAWRRAVELLIEKGQR